MTKQDNKEGTYCITPSILYDIVHFATIYAVTNPEKHFCADEHTDELGDFLSCFFLEDDQDGYPIWELNGVNNITESEVSDADSD